MVFSYGGPSPLIHLPKTQEIVVNGGKVNGTGGWGEKVWKGQSSSDILHEDILMLIWNNQKPIFFQKEVLFYLCPHIASFLNVLSLSVG